MLDRRSDSMCKKGRFLSVLVLWKKTGKYSLGPIHGCESGLRLSFITEAHEAEATRATRVSVLDDGLKMSVERSL